MSALRLAFAVVAVAIVWSQPARAGDIGAYVVDYDAPPGSVRILRGQKEVALSVGLPLEVGDVVVTASPATLKVDDGAAVRDLKSETSPYVVQKPGLVGAGLAKLRQVMEIVSWQAAPSTVPMRTRGADELDVLLLKGAAPKLYAGRRNLSLGWIEGAEKVHWDVINNGRLVGTGEMSKSQPSNSQWLDVTVDLSPGPVQFVATMGSVTKRFAATVVPGAGLATARPASPLARIAAAVELSRKEDGAYLLEAAQLLSSIDATRAEVALRDAMRIGERP